MSVDLKGVAKEGDGRSTPSAPYRLVYRDMYVLIRLCIHSFCYFNFEELVFLYNMIAFIYLYLFIKMKK